MEKLKSLIKSKKFWTLVIAIVTALSAFFLSACSAQYISRTKGVHIDTVERTICTHSKNHANDLH